MIKDNIIPLRSALSELTTQIAQVDSLLRGYQQVEGFTVARGEVVAGSLNAATLSDVEDGASDIQTAFNGAAAIFVAEGPV